MIPQDLIHPLPSKELVIFQLLHERKHLSKSAFIKFEQLTRGYEGEKKFFKQLKEQVHPSAIIINNLILRSGDSEVQIDSLLIVGNDIYLFEVKNYYGDYLIKNDRWYNVKNQNEISNPLLQLNRSRYLLKKTLQQQSFNFDLHTHLIFINKQFTLYMPSPNNNIVLPTQLPRFLTQLSNQPYQYEQNHIQLLKYLTSNHRQQSRYTRLPEYHFNQLKKGMTCVNCNRFVARYNKNNFKCSYCRKIIEISILLINAIEEFQILFPDKKMTVNLIHEWCGRLVADKTVRKVLDKKYKKIDRGKSTYYMNN